MTRVDLERVARTALAEIDLGARASKVLATIPRASVLAIGKAARAMAGDREALVIGTGDAGHPIPDRRSVLAAEACLELAERGRGPLVVLISGGASALVCAPIAGVTLRDKQALTRTMLRSGASIQELNVVRKHLSRIKGGGLRRAAGARRVVTLVASDVIGGRVSDIGSGPTAIDPSTRGDARRLLRRFAPAFATLPLIETSGGGRPRILACPEELAQIVARILGARVLRASQADVSVLAKQYLQLANTMSRGIYVRAAEPSVTVTGKGRGGRSTHLAALVLRDLPPGVQFLAMATDGVDGTSGTAGALVKAGMAERAELDNAIEQFDTGPLLRRIGASLIGGPTGHNLADLHILMKV